MYVGFVLIFLDTRVKGCEGRGVEGLRMLDGDSRYILGGINVTMIPGHLDATPVYGISNFLSGIFYIRS